MELKTFNLQSVTPASANSVNFELQPITVTVFDYIGTSTLTIHPTSELYQVVSKLGNALIEIHPSGLFYTPFDHVGNVVLEIIPNSTVQHGVNTEKPIRIGRMLITLPNGKVVEIGIVNTGRSRVKAHMRIQIKVNEMGEFDVVDVNHPDASPIRITKTDGQIYALSKY